MSLPRRISKTDASIPHRDWTANERSIIGLIRQNGSMSKADIARSSGLSAQSATVIVKRLVEEGMLMAGSSVRGKVGQPSTPFKLDPLGAASVGVKVGRRSTEISTMALDQSVIAHVEIEYEYPVFSDILAKSTAEAQSLISKLDARQQNNILGVGLAIPDAVHEWESAIGAPEGAMSDWDEVAFADQLSAAIGLPVQSMNDASSACLAERMLGTATDHGSFAYIYVGTFIGGGIAIENRVFGGLTGNAGAIGSLPVEISSGKSVRQLIEAASLNFLESKATTAGLSSGPFYAPVPLSAEYRQLFEDWLTDAAPAIAFTAIASQAFLDLGVVVLDTALSPSLRDELYQAVLVALEDYDHRGLRPFDLVQGNIGIRARSLGSSLLPFQTALEPDQTNM